MDDNDSLVGNDAPSYDEAQRQEKERLEALKLQQKQKVDRDGGTDSRPRGNTENPDKTL